jgi:peptidylprolyl isomerase
MSDQNNTKIDICGDGGVIKEILNQGEGDSPVKGQNVYVCYEGKLLDGSVFDSNQDKVDPFKFSLGVGQVINGWDVGVATMKRGEKSVFTLLPEYGYGQNGAGNSIPPNATLIFTVELIDFVDVPKSKSDLSKEEKVNFAKEKKTQGNAFVKAQKYAEAIKKFEEAYDYLKDEIKNLNDEETTLYCVCMTNICICCNKTGEYVKGITFASNAIHINITSKVIYQRGLALANNAGEEEDLVFAIEDLDKLKELVGDKDPAYQNLNSTIVNKRQLIAKNKKKLYGGFLNSGMYEEKEEPVSKVVDLKADPAPGNPIVFMDIKYGNSEPKRVEFELFKNHTPKTAENFRALCTGEKGIHYKNTIFHRLIKGFMLQGGDYENANGTGGSSIYGAKFEDENFNVQHKSDGLLSMANSGKNTNGSQFFITFKETGWLDGKHVVFGRVLKGMDTIKEIEQLETDNDKPTSDIIVADCGQLSN